MTTNLVKYMNSMLKGARSLSICALLKITFQNINAWFVERGLKADSMLRAGVNIQKTSLPCSNKITRNPHIVMFNATIKIILNSRCKRYRTPINIGQNQSDSLSD